MINNYIFLHFCHLYYTGILTYMQCRWVHMKRFKKSAQEELVKLVYFLSRKPTIVNTGLLHFVL